MDGISLPPAPARVKRSASARILAQEWPQLFKACISTYFEYRSFSVVDDQRRSAAGYMLHGAIAAEKLYADKHPQRPLSRTMLDHCFACELWFHFRRNRTFNRPQAALYQSLLNLVLERPEKLQRLLH